MQQVAYARVLRSWLMCLGLAGPWLVAGLATGGSASLAGELAIGTPTGEFRVSVATLKEARFRTIIKQRYDYSCGSAAIASLLTFHYGQPTTEQEVFKAMYAAGDKEKIRARGFSLLDMKRYIESRGIAADGYRVPLEKLAEGQVPAIVLITTGNYKHFVIVKGLSDSEVVVGDPALGVKIMTRASFAKLLVNDIVFIVREKKLKEQERFNDPKDWAVRAKAPFGTALNLESLASFSLTLPGMNEF